VSERLPISVTVSGVRRLFGNDLSQLIEFAKRAEDAGIDQIAMTDHLAIGPHTDRYPYGAFPFPNDEPWPEPLVTLAAMAGATRRIRLATAVLVAQLRSALSLAKSLATLDALSGGRVDFGVGVGWQKEEFDASGIRFGARTARMMDGLRAARGADGRVDLDRSIAEGIPRVREAGATIAAFPIAAYVRHREELPAFLARF
jgi:alkanesulfonate monooxygenase SsuD/methylene tetrahydromethanopterin reductase-like flavin-dependent oxidoreductase (luciferase family)